MTVSYSNLNTTASRLIKNFGQEVTFTRLAETYTPTGFSSSSSTYTADLVVIDQPKTQDEQGLIAESKTALASSSTAILISDSVEVNSEHFRVNNVKTVRPASTTLFYELELVS